MGTAILVDTLYDKGKQLIESMDSEGYRYPIELLINYPDGNEWNILIGVPKLRQTGARDLYGEIYNIIKKKNINLSLSNVYLEDTQSEICKNIRSAIKTGNDIGKIPFVGKYINGQRFPDAIIYRVK